MDFDLSDDQIALREAAVGLLDREKWWENLRARVGPGTIVGTLPGSRKTEPGEGAKELDPSLPGSGYDKELWAAMAEQGWLLVERPQDEGGLGGAMVEVAVLCEEIGKRVCAVPFLSSALSLNALALSKVAMTTPSLRSIKEKIADGNGSGCIAWSPKSSGFSLKKKGSSTTLDAKFAPVVYGPSASVAIIPTGKGLFAVALTTTSRPIPQSAMDRTRELGWLDLKNAEVIQIGDGESGTRVFDRAVIGVCAEMLGSAQKVLDMSVSYAKDRVQFGKPIGSFQAVKHRLSDMLVDLEGMRSTVYYAAWCSSVTSPETSLAASMAKAWCSDASSRIMSSGLQVHGGIGFTWEHDMHLFLKRAQLDQVSFGKASWHKDRIGSILKAKVVSGESIF